MEDHLKSLFFKFILVGFWRIAFKSGLKALYMINLQEKVSEEEQIGVKVYRKLNRSKHKPFVGVE